MEPISMIVAALVAGATAAVQETAGQAVKDAYNRLKELLVARFGDQGGVSEAIEDVEKKPTSTGRQAVLAEELAAAGAASDPDLLARAEALLELLQGQAGVTYTAEVSGSGAVAQGPGAVAAGQGGIAIGGDVSGGALHTGPQQTGKYHIVVENAQGLAIGDQQQVTQYFGGAAGEASGTSAGPTPALATERSAGASVTARDLRQRQAELQDRYDALTDRIAAVEKDLRRAMDSEQKLTLRDRLAELIEERKQVAAALEEIEKRLA